MAYKIDLLVDLILNKSEQGEENAKQTSELKNLTNRQLQCVDLVMELSNPTPSDLAQRLQITKPSASVLIDKLSDRGYLRKIKSDSDRRSAHVHLTQKGQKAAQLHSKVHENFAKVLTKELTDSEVNILEILLNKAVRSFL